MKMREETVSSSLSNYCEASTCGCILIDTWEIRREKGDKAF